MRMRSICGVVVLLFLMAGVVAAEAAFVSDAKKRPSERVVSVEEARKLPDDTRVVLRGYIVDHLRSDHYTFRDETGRIAVEIDDDNWHGLDVGPDDRVEIYGEVDRDFSSVEIEVNRIILIEARN